MSEESILFALQVICSSASDIAFSLMWGSVLLLYWNALPDKLLSALYKYLNNAAAVLCIALPLQLLLLAANMASTTHWAELRPILPDVLAMHAGSVLRSQFICVLLVPLSTLLPLPPTMRRPLSMVLLLALTSFKATAGHAAVDGTFSLREISQWLHLVSIASWAGGILLSAWLILPRFHRNDARLPSFLHRLSSQSAVSVAVVFLSGLINSWLTTEGRWAPLRSSSWGTLLIVKIAFVLLALGIGFQNHRSLGRELNVNTLQVIANRIRLEAWIMLVILCASGFLSNLSPA